MKNVDIAVALLESINADALEQGAAFFAEDAS